MAPIGDEFLLAGGVRRPALTCGLAFCAGWVRRRPGPAWFHHRGLALAAGNRTASATAVRLRLPLRKHLLSASRESWSPSPIVRQVRDLQSQRPNLGAISTRSAVRGTTPPPFSRCASIHPSQTSSPPCLARCHCNPSKPHCA